ncbi:50S ribosomal protein L9 [Frankliniella fusca]|uniref:50S ribosomal protein L9 n=1 Tax=Frankliniella fusca TaxID=407009 RepID=A0AAE1L6Y2_9NEOP|nr:50S ribosomal protein L9 [Frankliniella fusca]
MLRAPSAPHFLRRWYSEGDIVWFLNPRRRVGVNPKLQRPWEHGWRVAKVLNDVTVRIERPGCKTRVVHVDRLAKDREGNGAGQRPGGAGQRPENSLESGISEIASSQTRNTQGKLNLRNFEDTEVTGDTVSFEMKCNGEFGNLYPKTLDALNSLQIRLGIGL